MFGYIYKTTNLINNKIYIGKKHSNIFITSYFGSGKLIKRALEKYGMENFKVELIEFCDDLETLNEKEKFYIKSFDSIHSSGKGYNIAFGGDGGNLLANLPKEEYDKFIEDCKNRSHGMNNPNYGNGIKISGDKNPSKRKEVREKLSKASSSSGNAMYGIKGQDHPRYGTKHTDETRDKIKKALKNVTYNKVCKNCGITFVSKNARTSYCNADCKREYRDNHKK